MPPRTDVLIVIPTLGDRLSYLEQTLTSVLAQDPVPMVRVVVPSSRVEARSLARDLGAEIIDDPGSLPAAVNSGVEGAPAEIAYVNWIGDDDLLTEGSLSLTRGALASKPTAVVSYGSCEYIDDQGEAIWLSQAGRHAQWILPWGPDLIPQPGMLVRRDAWDRVGGVDASLRFAFDLDLLLKLKREGSFIDVGAPVSRFRWHAESLTVSDRTQSLDESERVKRRYLSARARRWSWTWEKPVRGATRIAAWEMNRRARKLLDSR